MEKPLKEVLTDIQSRKHIQQIGFNYSDLQEQALEEFKRFRNAVPVKNTLEAFLEIVESLPVPRLFATYQSIGLSLEDYYPVQANGSHIDKMRERIESSFEEGHQLSQELVTQAMEAPYEVITELYLFAEVDEIFLMLPIVHNEANRLHQYLIIGE